MKIPDLKMQIYHGNHRKKKQILQSQINIFETFSRFATNNFLFINGIRVSKKYILLQYHRHLVCSHFNNHNHKVRLFIAEIHSSMT